MFKASAYYVLCHSGRERDRGVLVCACICREHLLPSSVLSSSHRKKACFRANPPQKRKRMCHRRRMCAGGGRRGAINCPFDPQFPRKKEKKEVFYSWVFPKSKKELTDKKREASLTFYHFIVCVVRRFFFVLPRWE